MWWTKFRESGRFLGVRRDPVELWRGPVEFWRGFDVGCSLLFYLFYSLPCLYGCTSLVLLFLRKTFLVLPLFVSCNYVVCTVVFCADQAFIHVKSHYSFLNFKSHYLGNDINRSTFTSCSAIVICVGSSVCALHGGKVTLSIYLLHYFPQHLYS